MTALIAVVSADNLASGIASAAFIAYLSSLTNVSYSATQYALFSSMMLLLPKFVAGFSGDFVDSFGYAHFFTTTSLLGLPVLGTDFVAYDIHEPRITFLNHYFILQGLPPLAFVRDVALHVPTESGDVALFLKEMPRFERNYPGRGRALLDALDVRWLVVSFPTISTHGGRNLTNRYREFFHQIIDGTGWPVTELLFDTELVFCAEKTADGRPQTADGG